MNAKYLVIERPCYGDYEDMVASIRVCESYTLEETNGYEVYEILDNGKIGDVVKGYDEYF